MNLDPMDVALRQIAETRFLLENLLTSSEGFDYPKAKDTLRQLQRKVRELARLQTELARRKRTELPEDVVPFPYPAEQRSAR